jgi:hypothetical protein
MYVYLRLATEEACGCRSGIGEAALVDELPHRRQSSRRVRVGVAPWRAGPQGVICMRQATAKSQHNARLYISGIT